MENSLQEKLYKALSDDKQIWCSTSQLVEFKHLVQRIDSGGNPTWLF
jgi:hypothetical protein